MNGLKLPFFILIVMLALGSCQEKVPVEPIKAGSVKDFPNSVGSSWTYHVIDNLQPVDSIKPVYIIDTVVTTIDRFATDPQFGLAAVWTYIFNNNPSQQIPERPVIIRGDTVYMYWNFQNNDKIGLVFPFDIRDSWQTGGLLSGDRTTVIDTTAITLGGSIFNKVYVLENNWRTSISTDSRTITMWFVPDFGIIKMHFHEEHALSVGDTTWLLFDHNNPNF